ncbi:MAG: TRAP transporter small permease [Desulfobacterales bacterium]|jgi:TRAP-type C4-dicarboxylate transport system permease small subunit
MNKNANGYGIGIHLERIRLVLHRVEDSLLVAILTLMISLAAIQILLRNLFGGGIIWGDVLVRVLVLWIGLVGAMVATRQNKHISIDLVARYLPKKFSLPVKAVVELFAAVVCGLAAYYSLIFVYAEYYDGGAAFGQVPVWVCEAIMPAGLPLFLWLPVLCLRPLPVPPV